MDFVGCKCVPDDEFSILRRGHEVSFIRGPMHGVNFGQMSFEGTLDLHLNARQRREV